MKHVLKTWLTIFAAMAVLPVLSKPGHGQPKNDKSIDVLLTAHQWTLVEILQKKNDTITNMTLLMMPCEKDNFLQYSNSGTYQILEGQTKCNEADNLVKGQGAWQYDPEDSSLVERYEGGSRIAKRIRAINDNKLVLQYEGEGRRVFTLTYLSEKGQENKEEEGVVVDDSDPSQHILLFIKEYLQSTNRYVLVNKKEFDSGVQAAGHDKDSPLKTVVLLPFANTTEEKKIINKDERNKALIEQAARSGVDYVITGNVMEAVSAAKDNKNFIGTVRFEIMLIDVADSTRRSQLFNAGQAVKTTGNVPKKKSFLGKLADRALNAAPGVLTVIGLTRGYKSYQALYTAAVVTNAAQKTYTTATLFSNVNSVARERNYDSTTAVLTAVEESEAEVQEFVADHVTPKIKINRVEGTGKKAKLIIEAGGNIFLQKGEELKVIRVINTTVAGKTVKERKELGRIKVEEVAADVLSYCSITEGGNDITDAYSKAPHEIVVITTIQEARTGKK